MHKKNQIYITTIALILLTLTSCNSIGFLSEKNSWLPREIESLGDFLGVYFVLQISIFLVSLLLAMAFGDGSNLISLLLHFIWIISYRDYGFFTILFLFALEFALLIVIDRIIFFIRNN